MASPLATPDSAAASAANAGAVASLISTLESTLNARARGPSGPSAGPGEGAGDTRPADVSDDLDRELVELCRERGPLRAVLARIAFRLVWLRAWERLGYARLSDYAVECLGLSARWVRSLAMVGARLDDAPLLEHALVSGELGWTKVRLLARLPHEEDDAAWIEYARRVTAEELSRVVREVDRGSVEAGAATEEGAKSRVFEVRCSPEVRWKWHAARSAAARAAGRVLHPSEAAELIAAEVLSGLPMDEDAGDGPCHEAGVSWSQAGEVAADAVGSEGCEGEEGRERSAGVDRGGPRRRGRAAGPPHPPWWGDGAEPARPDSPEPRGSVPPPSYPPVLQAFLVGLDDADAFDLDDRLRRALAREQRLDARVGPLLTVAWEHWVYRTLGYATREAYARERLGMDPTRARTLVRLERVAGDSRAFAEAYRSGALSGVKASVLAPLVAFDPLGRFVDEWVTWAGRVTVRRLREDVEGALALVETDPRAFRLEGGLPPEARDDREIGAQPKGAEGYSPEPGHPPEECRARFIGPPDIVQLFQAVLRTVRRRVGRDTGRLPTPGEALGVMLDHVFSAWGEIDGKVAARHRVFARDGWRCAVPGCTSMQNLHDHHIRFRSAGGEDSPDNRITVCAFHHLRGVHAGILRCVGRAPDGLRWEMGLRDGVSPRLAYRSGDVEVEVSPAVSITRLRV